MGAFGLTLANRGVQEIAVRLASWQQRRQFDLVLNEVAPAFAAGRRAATAR